MSKQHVLSLHPTQFAIGMREVEQKAKKLRRLSSRRLRKYLHKNPVKVIRSPQKELYVADRHHELMACWLVGVKRVRVQVKIDCSGRRMSQTKFWRFMSSHDLVHLYDQFGDGPRDPLYLPVDIRGLSDDPYRSLAWLARCEGAYQKTDVPYADFEWAQLLRQHRLLSRGGRSQLHRALPEAIRVCQSSAAAHLPGFRRPRRQRASTRQSEGARTRAPSRAAA